MSDRITFRFGDHQVEAALETSYFGRLYFRIWRCGRCGTYTTDFPDFADVECD